MSEEKSFSPSIILDRLGLTDKMNQDNLFCEGEGCTGCVGYTQGEKGKCSGCGCDMIDHNSFSDDDFEYDDDDYESTFGGGETW